MAAGRDALPLSMIGRILEWYFQHWFSSWDVTALPFYCDPERVGTFAVSHDELRAGYDAAIFRLFVTLSMYQALRDVVISDRQRRLPDAAMREVADATWIERSVVENRCPVLISAEGFEFDCDVRKLGGVVDCGRFPGRPCHVKGATKVFNRMGDMGKLPTSAWLRIWQDGGLQKLLHQVCGAEASPTGRAALLVDRFAQVHRVGRKLATMFVSALSTPALAPGLTPWFPDIDGNELVVVDTNVARAVDTLGGPGVTRTYEGRTRWVCDHAAQIDLREFGVDLPSYSPRLVQQALYAFCSKSNRLANHDRCAGHQVPCEDCVPQICPFAT